MNVRKYANMRNRISFFLITASDRSFGRILSIHIKNRKLTKYNNVIQKEINLITKKDFDKV